MYIFCMRIIYEDAIYTYIYLFDFCNNQWYSGNWSASFDTQWVGLREQSFKLWVWRQHRWSNIGVCSVRMFNKWWKEGIGIATEMHISKYSEKGIKLAVCKIMFCFCCYSCCCCLLVAVVVVVVVAALKIASYSSITKTYKFGCSNSATVENEGLSWDPLSVKVNNPGDGDCILGSGPSQQMSWMATTRCYQTLPRQTMNS